MSLSPAMRLWVIDRLVEARDILSNNRSTPSQRTIARLVIDQHGRG
jgi:hypothetical protein